MTNNPPLLALGASIVALMIYLLIVIVTLRLMRFRLMVTVFAGCAITIFGLTVAFAHAGLAMISIWHFSAFFGGGVAIAVFVFGALLKSLSLKMLTFVASAPEERATVEQLSNHVIAAEFLKRIQLLEKSGFVRQTGSDYTITASGQHIASRFYRLRKLLGLESSRFYSD